MRTNPVRTVIAALALSALAGAAWAQDPPTPAANTLDLTQQVARAEPADHASLSEHFGALADRYAAEATQHGRMAVASATQPKSAGLTAHCRSLSNSDRELERDARALATFHQARATGAPAAASARGAHPEGVAAGSTSQDQELKDVTVKAAETNDHRALAAYFSTLAARYTADADSHATMAASYRSNSRLAQVAVHCDRLIKTSRAAAKEARMAAELHKRLGATS